MLKSEYTVHIIRMRECERVRTCVFRPYGCKRTTNFQTYIEHVWTTRNLCALCMNDIPTVRLCDDEIGDQMLH